MCGDAYAYTLLVRVRQRARGPGLLHPARAKPKLKREGVARPTHLRVAVVVKVGLSSWASLACTRGRTRERAVVAVALGLGCGALGFLLSFDI